MHIIALFLRITKCTYDTKNECEQIFYVLIYTNDRFKKYSILRLPVCLVQQPGTMLV